jgi:hypothetical protein
MSRILHFALLGLALALPLAIPRVSQAAGPRCYYPTGPSYSRYCRPNGWYHWHGYCHGHHRR